MSLRTPARRRVAPSVEARGESPPRPPTVDFATFQQRYDAAMRAPVAPPASSAVLPFGKYRHVPLSQVPTAYLCWAQRQVTFRSRALADAVEAEHAQRCGFVHTFDGDAETPGGPTPFRGRRHRRVTVEVTPITLEGDSQGWGLGRVLDQRFLDHRVDHHHYSRVVEIPSVSVGCTRCGHAAEVYGDGEDSITRGCVMLREACPRGEQNFYVPDGDGMRPA